MFYPAQKHIYLHDNMISLYDIILYNVKIIANMTILKILEQNTHCLIIKVTYILLFQESETFIIRV